MQAVGSRAVVHDDIRRELPALRVVSIANLDSAVRVLILDVAPLLSQLLVSLGGADGRLSGDLSHDALAFEHFLLFAHLSSGITVLAVDHVVKEIGGRAEESHFRLLSNRASQRSCNLQTKST